MKQTSKLAAIILGLALQTTAAWAIECGKAKTAFEIAICSSPELLKRDAELNTAFKQALKKSDDAGKALRVSQQKWLDRVQGLAQDKTALTAAYAARIEMLKQMFAGPSIAQQAAKLLNGKGTVFTTDREDFGIPPLIGLAKSAVREVQADEAVKVLDVGLKGNEFWPSMRKGFLGWASGGYADVIATDINKDGKDDFVLTVQQGTMHCSTRAIFLSGGQGTAYSLAYVPEGGCSNEGNGEGQYAFLGDIAGKTYFIEVQNSAESSTMSFVDFTTEGPRRSDLMVIFKRKASIEGTGADCKIADCAYWLEDPRFLTALAVPDGYPKLTTELELYLQNGGARAPEGDEGNYSKQEKARPLFDAVISSSIESTTEAKPFVLENGTSPEEILLDIDNDGTPEVVSRIYDKGILNDSVAFVDDPSGTWQDPSKLQLRQLSRDFLPYNSAEIERANDSYSSWNSDAKYFFLNVPGDRVYIGRFGSKRIGFSNWYCCHVEVHWLEDGKMNLAFSSPVNHRFVMERAAGSAWEPIVKDNSYSQVFDDGI